jgi:hypothetical protein
MLSSIAALERRTLTWDEFQDLVGQGQSRAADMIHLDSGYWLRRDDIALECTCQCERTHCIGAEGKVHC